MREKKKIALNYENLLTKGNPNSIHKVLIKIYKSIGNRTKLPDTFITEIHLLAIGAHTKISSYKEWDSLIYGIEGIIEPLKTAKKLAGGHNPQKTAVSDIRKDIKGKYGDYYSYLINTYDRSYSSSIIDYTSLILRNIILDNNTQLDEKATYEFGRLQCNTDSTIYTPYEAPFICFLWRQVLTNLNLKGYFIENNRELLEKEKHNIEVFISEYDNILHQINQQQLDGIALEKMRMEIASLVCDPQTVSTKRLCELINKAATIFLHVVTLAYCESHRISIQQDEIASIFSTGGTNVMTDTKQLNEQAVLNLYQMFNSNSLLQQVYGNLVDDYLSMSKDSRNKPEIRNKVSDGAIGVYLKFLDLLLPLIPNHYPTISKLFNTAIYAAYNNPAVQELIFSSEQIFNAKEFYFSYYQQTELHAKYGDDTHSSEHEMLQIPLVEYDFLSAAVTNNFLKNGEDTLEFRWHCYADHWSLFRIRKAVDNNDVKNIAKLNANENDKSIFIKSKESECLQAMNCEQLFMVEEVNDDTSRLAAFAILCVDVITQGVTYGKTINNEIINNHPEMSFAETSVLNTIYVSESWRGYGLQRLLTSLMIKMAESKRKKQILLTVSPTNEVSYKNLQAMKFQKIGNVEYDGGIMRDFCCRYL